MVNVLFIVHILRFPPSRFLARKNMLETWTRGFADQVAAVMLTECL